MNAGGIILGGVQSGSGKTAIACAVLAALRARGVAVQPFKVGPDFIDPAYHTFYAGRTSRTLDQWLLGGETAVRNEVARQTADGCFGVVEGVMGLFDGAQPGSDDESTMALARLLDWPVVLVVPAAGAGRTLAAALRGFVAEAGPGRIAGVILNRVGSGAHGEYLGEAIRPLQLPILGAVPHEQSLRWPERHLGLQASQEIALPAADTLAALAERHLDLDRFLDIGRAASQCSPGGCEPGRGAIVPPANRSWRIGLARDEAFHFYYPTTLEALETMGAELVPFSPVHDPALPDGIDALLLGGGFPEMHADALADNAALRGELRRALAAGLPCHAECGALMYLCEAMRPRDGDAPRPMVGAIPGTVEMTPGLQRFGYCAVAWRNRRIPGHEFHHSRWLDEFERANLWSVRRRRTGEARREGYRAAGLRASFVHFHYATAGAMLMEHLGMIDTPEPQP